MADLLTLILAAGQGTRMKSKLTKVLHPVAGKPMVQQVIDVVEELSSEIVCVVGHQAGEVQEVIKGNELNFVVQAEQLGTGHAVMQARDHIKKHQGPVLVLYGDTPLLTESTLKKIIDLHQQEAAALTVLTARVEEPAGYGRVIRNDQGQVLKIVEDKDATAEEREINEINSGVYCFDSRLLVEALDSLDNDNAQAEYYLTDAVSFLNNKGKKVIPVIVDDPEEIRGINDRKSLARAEKIIRKRINEYHLYNGVTIIDPSTTYIDADVKIGRDTVIYPFTYLEGQTNIGSDCIIGPHSRLVDASLGDCVQLKVNSIIWNSSIDDECTIGPFAYIRPGCTISRGAKVGDFVELKKAFIGERAKVPHLSYVGDAEIGSRTNIGAGTIFANYDGVNKHITIVGEEAFVGSNSTLVAPIRIGDRGKTGAGAVVTRDVPDETTVVGVPARIINKKDGQN